MTLCVAVSRPGLGAVLVCDRRGSITIEEESRTLVMARDNGGKLLRVGGAWVTYSYRSNDPKCRSATDALPLVLQELARLDEEGSLLTPSALATHLTRAVSGQDHGVMQFLMLSRAGIARLAFDPDTDVLQAEERPHRRGGLMPIGYADERVHTIIQALLPKIGKTRTPWDLMRWACAIFRETAPLIPQISPTIDLAWNDLCLLGDADELSRSTDAALQAALRAPSNEHRPSTVLASRVDATPHSKHPETFFLAAPKNSLLP